MSRKLRITAVVLIAALIAVYLLRYPIFTALGNFLIKADQPEKADAALVLAGDGYGFRLLTAAALARQGYVPKVFVSGPAGSYGFYECDLAIPFAVRNGYPESYFVHMEHFARSTKEEARAVIPELRRRGIHKVLLVTSNFHTRRAGKIFRAAAPDMTFVVIAAPDEDFTPNGWWRSRDAEKTFLMEWEKTVATWFGM